jgi:ribonuclease PH
MRHDSRKPDQLRPIKIKRGFTRSAAGSVWIQAGRTTVLCTASIEPGVPPWMKAVGQIANLPKEGTRVGQVEKPLERQVGNLPHASRGWLTAEYSMLPGSTAPRKRRERGANLDGRTTEIQRLIGRSLRAVTNLDMLGERTITIDCDVLEADGGTRTLSITGGFIALVDALRSVAKSLPDPTRLPLSDSVAAVSVGIVDGRPVLDLDYAEDFAAEVDMNVVMIGSGRFVEIQGTGEEATFGDEQLSAMLALARDGIRRLTAAQCKAMGRTWPFE